MIERSVTLPKVARQAAVLAFAWVLAIRADSTPWMVVNAIATPVLVVLFVIEWRREANLRDVLFPAGTPVIYAGKWAHRPAVYAGPSYSDGIHIVRIRDLDLYVKSDEIVPGFVAPNS